MKKEVPPLSKNKTSENWLHSSEGPSPVGRCWPTAFCSMSAGAKFSHRLARSGPRSVCFCVSVDLQVLHSTHCHKKTQTHAPLYSMTEPRAKTFLRVTGSTTQQDRMGSMLRRLQEELGSKLAPPSTTSGVRPLCPPQKFVQLLPQKDIARSSLRPTGTPLHTSHGKLRLPRRLPLGGQSSQLPYLLLSD